ncbi:serine/threonine-protein kinase [Antrihabitans sp. NCIMB 15449]
MDSMTFAAATEDSTSTAMYQDPSLATAGAFVEPGGMEDLDTIEVGMSIDDFDLLTVLGSGAFARVFLARQRSMQRLVAVKVSADHGTEPQTLAQLDHDYIVRIFDQRLIADRKLKLLYMQFLPGGTLLGVLQWVRATPEANRSGALLLDAIDAAMEEKGEIRPTDSSVRAEIAQLSWPETVAWLGRRLADALDYAGGRGVLHRDVKPANVLLTAEGVPKLADFNISFSRNVTGASPVAYFGGSLSYMSPEQLAACHPGRPGSAAELDTRSDIYSLGVVLWELLTGHKPFGNEGVQGGDTTTLDRMIERRNDGIAADAFTHLPADCPAALRRVLMTCLAPVRTDRWSTGTELAQQLDLCMDARARDLVDPPPDSWRLRLRKWAIPVIALAMGIPNALASVYNIHHNQTLIISRLDEDAQLKFGIITQIINLTFFPLGAAVIIYICRYVLSVSRGMIAGKTYDPKILARARRDALRMGDVVVAIAFLLWVIAGIAFPITLQLVAGNIPADAYVHFIGSLVVCGAIAVAYPFFLVNLYIVRSIYPMFLTYGETSKADARQLRNLDRRCNQYLAIAASVPLLGVAGVTFIPPGDIPSVIFAVRVLCVGGIIAFVATYWIFRSLEEDLRALQRVVSSESDR